MIEFQCDGCDATYRVSDEKAGIRSRCKECNTEFTVPPAPAAPPVQQSELGRGGGPAGEGRLSMSSITSSSSGVRATQRFAATGGRPLPPAVEEANRRRNIMLLGAVLIAGFLLPTLSVGFSMGGSRMKWEFPNIEGLTQSGNPWQMDFVLAFPAAAGFLLLLLANMGRVPKAIRGGAMIAAVASLIGVVITAEQSGVRAMLEGMLSTSGLQSLLGIVALAGLVLAARARWYRPNSNALFILGAIGAVATLGLLFFPFNGEFAVATPFQMMRFMPIAGVGLLLSMGALFVAALLSLSNTCGRVPEQSSNTSRLIFRLLLASIGFVLLIPIFASFQVGFNIVALFAGFLSVAKLFCWVGGIMLLLPTGIGDLILGDAAPSQPRHSHPDDGVRAAPNQVGSTRFDENDRNAA